MTAAQPPSLAEIQKTRALLGDRIAETPIYEWRGPEILAAAGAATSVVLKLELFQHTGTFKPRGALNVMLHLPPDRLARGVTAVSAGNHAIAVAYAAGLLGASAKVVMPKTASPFRVARVRAYGGDVVLTETIAEAFEAVERLEQEEGRAFVHPFEGPYMVRGTATVGWEFCRQDAGLDAVIVPIGGGGLISGIAAAIRHMRPDCAVYGVEPEGAPTLTRSLEAGRPIDLGGIATIADSLGAPHAKEMTFALVRDLVDEVVLIDDGAMKRGMAFLFRNLKLAVEPAGAAALAALLGPLRARLDGRRVGLVVCGANIDRDSYCRWLAEGEDLL